MALSPKQPGRKEPDNEQTAPKVPWVSWIAIGLGVTMTGIGIILLLWGFMWQAEVGEPRSLNGEELVGGPALIPFGGAMATVGILWILTGWRGFKKDRESDDMMRCPHCGKMIESDLNFCYFCNTTFDIEEKDEERRPEKGVEAGNERPLAGRESKRAKPFSPEDRT
ncbi:MAG: hypothetical protein ACMUHY_03175 [Thermoplasmatota archaeon]